jgi:transposase
MRKSRFTDEQIVAVLHEVGAGAKNTEVCRRHGIADTTFQRWRRKYRGLQVSEAKRLRALEEENRQLKAAGGRSSAESPGGQRPAGKKVVTPAQRRTAVTQAIAAAGLSERQACRFTGFARASQRYRSQRPPHTALRDRLPTPAKLRPRWGYRRLHRLLRREGRRVNRKLVYRLYREVGLAVRRRRRKRVAVARQPLPAPPAAGALEHGVSQRCAGLGRKFRS